MSYPENVIDRMQVYSGSFITWDINEVGGYFIPGFESLTDDGIQEYTERDKYFNAEEAKNFGLIDEVYRRKNNV